MNRPGNAAPSSWKNWLVRPCGKPGELHMLQELVMNVVKHARASRADLSLDVDEDRLQNALQTTKKPQE
ncbi:hypothetical protein [Pedobacter yulinensis]|uniref:hypothetical protein n=1 Tax=Pedobacter yulinensis TaxID=2126353 RepID=UPI0013A63B07|nr:hypothetical protein [Pedobacter yulinensis]